MNDIFDEVRWHIYLVHNDKQKLQKILDFILEEIYEEPEEEAMKIPQAFEKLVKPIAESIDGGLIYYINMDTMETEDIPKELEDPEEYEFEYGDDALDTKPKFYNWENTLRFKPLESQESFKIMDAFADEMQDAKFQLELYNALNHKKPFSNYKRKIDNSPYQQNWFDFKQQWLESYVRKLIWSELNKSTEDD